MSRMFQEQFGLKAQLQNGNRLTLPFSTTSRRTTQALLSDRVRLVRLPLNQIPFEVFVIKQAHETYGPTEELESFQRSVLLKGTLI